MAGAVQHPQRAAGELQLGAVGQGPGHLHGVSPCPEARRHRPKRGRDFRGNPVAEHHAVGEQIVQLALAGVVREHRREAVQGGHLGSGTAREYRGEAEVIHVLVGDHQQFDVLYPVPEAGEALFELVQGLSGVRARVDERERRVLDQVRVDSSNLERGGNREPVDARLCCSLQAEILLLLVGPAHERISASTSSRRRSMSCAETSDSRHRRSRGSVFEGRTLKCQSS